MKSRVLQSLNSEQQEAVQATEGPVLILAGAGTGKTRVIAHRIAYLLETHPDLTPANILALTFSRKASQEMLERVEDLLGGTADELEVFTFHGFCHRFIQDHPLEAGIPSRFQLLDRIESWIFFRKLLPELKLALFWNYADPTDCIDGFLRFISRAKDERVSPEEFSAYAEKVEDPHERARCREVERVYRTVQERMRALGALDFGDLIVRTLGALEQRPVLLAQLQSKYRYILVDEFQDTNVAQIALLGMLAGKAGNLCVVGDDDQAIYRFRGASFASFLLMKQMFPGLKTIRLTQNYRSTPQILASADRLIRHNEPDRYDPEKSLCAQAQGGLPVEAVVCRDEMDETQKVIETIRTLAGKEPATTQSLQVVRPPPAAATRRWDRIAVLYRAHSHRDRLVQELDKAGVPFVVHGGAALFDQIEIKDLIAFLRVLLDPSDSVHLFRILSHPIWGIPPADLMAIPRAAKERRISLIEMLRSVGDLPVQPATQGAALELLRELDGLHPRVIREGVGTLVPRVVEETSLRTVFRPTSGFPAAGRSGNPLISLGRFLRFVYRYSQTHPGSEELSSFLWYLDSYRQAGGDGQEEEEEIAGNQVRLMTIHQAKGLEFEWVILLGLVQGRFPGRGRPEAIPFPVELMKEPLPQGDYHLQEERRLCYVACTRARQGLFLMTQERLYHRPSLFIRQMSDQAPAEEFQWRRSEGPAGAAPPAESSGSDSLAAERHLLQILKEIRALDPKDEAGFSERARRMTDLTAGLWKERGSQLEEKGPSPFPLPAKFSYTQLQTYRYCPMKYQYSYLYQIPVRPTPQMFFGIDLHGCLEGFFRKVMEGQVPSLEELLESFRGAFAPGRYGEPVQEQEYRRLGIDLLTSFYKKNEGAFGVPLFVEKSFSLAMGDASVQGVIDRVDPLGEGGIEIIDYKTGKPKSDLGPDDQLQLQLYALACREVLGLVPKRLSLYFLRSGEKLSFEQTPETLESTRSQVQEIVREIRSGDFSPTPSLMKCRRCDFRNLCPASMA
ncbi:MAG: ATP-dependent helicase [Candidatus Omnitrophica bacterium]|nr:ATP-dependent helicase [Candidatus Omnitrophota bacterium]